MCGICGIVDLKNRPINKDVLRKMNSTLVHRGPDDKGYSINAKCSEGLGARCLSIIDLKTGY